jgi:MFS family permease
MESLGTTILNTAVPTISAALKVAPLSMKAVLASYTLSLAVFIPISGWMADRFGTRRVFAYAIALLQLTRIAENRLIRNVLPCLQLWGALLELGASFGLSPFLT